MHLPLLDDILVILGCSLVIVFLLQYLKFPTVIGFLFTGVIIGPTGLSLVSAVEEVEVLSEIGVILLLFVIGLELSLSQLSKIKKSVFLGGGLQVALSTLAGLVCYSLIGGTWQESLFIGFLISLSSTAIVLSVLQEQQAISSPHGKQALAVLIFQDIIVVPMMLFTPLIAGESNNLVWNISELLLKSIALILFTFLGAKYIFPRILYQIAKTKRKELFLIATITTCFAVAYLTSQAGLSLALGAFIAGLIISESEYSHQATSIILPFRELFTSFFFISIGMLLDIPFFLEHIGVILLCSIILLLLKTSITTLAIWIIQTPIRVSFLTGLALFQIGEFAFILSKVGIEYGLLTELQNQYFLSISIVTLIFSPFVIFSLQTISKRLFQVRSFLGIPNKEVKTEAIEDQKLENHLIIIGYGVSGQHLANAAEYGGIPYIIIELNAETVKEEKERNNPIVYGDATHPHILETVRIHAARAVVVAISDEAATKRIVHTIRSLNQSIFIVARTRYLNQANNLIQNGANEVIPEELEASIEIFSKILHAFLLPEQEIQHFVQTVRSKNYALFQTQKELVGNLKTSQIPDFNIQCFHVNTSNPNIINRSLSEVHLRRDYGITVLAISRNRIVNAKIQADTQIKPGDLIFVYGETKAVNNFHAVMN